MTDTLVALLLVLLLPAAGTMALATWKLLQLHRRLHLQDRHIDRLYRAAATVVVAYHHVRHNGNARDRLALDQAIAELETAAEAARKQEPVE